MKSQLQIAGITHPLNLPLLIGDTKYNGLQTSDTVLVSFILETFLEKTGLLFTL